jgi:hypothetical protein
MLMVLETAQQYNIMILLAKETFDPQIAPIRAWAAQMELESMLERMTMGVIARLKAGKANTGQDRYGYIRVGEQIHILEEEAKWVRQIFAWYIQKTPLMQIRKRLIAANAAQKGAVFRDRSNGPGPVFRLYYVPPKNMPMVSKHIPVQGKHSTSQLSLSSICQPISYS